MLFSHQLTHVVKGERTTLTETPITLPTDIQLPGLHHIGLVVRDCDAATSYYKAFLGIKSFFTYNVPPMPSSLVYGKPTPFELRVGYATLGNMLFELLQPLDRVSPQSHFLEERGEGIHHLGFLVPSVDDYLAKIEGKGLHILAETGVPSMNVKTVYLGGDSLGGTVLELMQDGPGLQDFFQQVYQAIGHEPLQ